MITKSPSLVRKLKANKLVLGFAGVLAAGVIGSAGVAAAHPAPRTMYLPNKATCATKWSMYKFKNRGQCESYWNRHKHHQPGDPGGGSGGGSGYGGSNTGITVTVNGNGNVITIIVNYFSGH